MSQALTVHPETSAAIMESVIAKGDLAKLTPEERTRYYMEVCRSIGLNPLTKPFEYITLNNKLTLYARRDAADQLRKINNISVEIVDRSIVDDLITVHVRAKDATGRTDEDMGVVTIGNLKGEARANAILKAITKAKRRVTLSISGLGFLDESEIEDIPATAKAPPSFARAVAAMPPAPIELIPHDQTTGEIVPTRIPVPLAADGERPHWVSWGGAMIAAIRGSTDRDTVEAWVRANGDALLNCNDQAPKAYGSVQRAINEARGKFAAPEPDMIAEDDASTILAAG